MDYWGVKSYENDDAGDALDAGFDRVHGALYEELMDDRNPLSFEQVQARLASTRTLEAAIAALRESLALEDPPEEWDETARLALAGVVVRHAELGVPIPRVWLDRAIDWLENEDIEWEEATARQLRRQKEIKLLAAPSDLKSSALTASRLQPRFSRAAIKPRQLRRHLLEDRAPVPPALLPEQSHRRIPWTVRPPLQPPRVGCERKRQPDGNAKRPGKMPQRRIRSDHQIERLHGRRGVHEVVQFFADRWSLRTALRSRQAVRARECAGGSRARRPESSPRASSSARRNDRSRSRRYVGFPCQATPILKDADEPVAACHWLDERGVGRQIGNASRHRAQRRSEGSGRLISGACTANSGRSEPSGTTCSTPGQLASSAAIGF